MFFIICLGFLFWFGYAISGERDIDKMTNEELDIYLTLKSGD